MSNPVGEVRRCLRDPQIVALILLRLVVVVAVAAEVPDFGNATTDRYQAIARSPGTPYRDFPVEYAPGELLIAVSVGSSTAGSAVAGLAVIAFVSDLVTTLALLWGWGLRTARRYLWLGTPLLIFAYRRADLAAVALAVTGLMLAARRRDRWGGAVLAAAVLTRFWPVVLVPSWFVQRRWGAVRTFGVVLVVGIVCWAALFGPDAIRQVSTFRGATGFEVESSVGAVVWAFTGEHRVELDANRTGLVPWWFGPTTAILLAAVLAVIWFRAGRRPYLDPAGVPSVAALAALLLTSPVFSPQYVVWLVPWAAIAGRDSLRWPLVAAIPILLTSFLSLSWAIHLGLGPGRTQTLLLARNLSVLLLLVAYFVWTRDPAKEAGAATAGR